MRFLLSLQLLRLTHIHMIQYGIKNFRKFDSAGCEFSLAPITFFTGCNNSGKSSASKSIVLLSQMYKRLESIQEEFSFDDIYLDFSDKSINIGDYDSVMNRKAPKDLGLTFSFSTYSDYIQRNVFVELVFKKRPKEILNRAHLSSFIIRDEQQRCIIKGSDESGEMIICAPDESGLELWLFEQALFEIYFTQQESLPKRQRKEIRALLSDSGKRLRNNRSDIWDLLRRYFGFDDVFDSGAIQDLTTSFKGSGANHYASNLCLLIRSLREQKAPYLDAIDGANKEECIGNIKEMIRNEKDDRTRLLLLRALYSFRKSPFQSLSTFAYNAIKGVRYTAGRFLHPGYSSVWGYTYEALSLRHIGIKVEQEQMNQLRAALKKTMNDNELTDVELSLINKLLFSSNGHDTGEILEAIYSAIGISPAADYYYNPPRIFPGHYLFIRLLGFLLQGLFLPSSRNDLCFSNHDTEKIHFKDFNYIGTTSVSIKRLYSESDNTDLLTSILLKRDFDFSFTNKWLWKLGLGNSLEIVPAPQGIGFFIYIKSNRGGILSKHFCLISAKEYPIYSSPCYWLTLGVQKMPCGTMRKTIQL